MKLNIIHQSRRLGKSEAWILAVKAAVVARPDKQIMIGCSNPISTIETLKHHLTDVSCEIVSPNTIRVKLR